MKQLMATVVIAVLMAGCASPRATASPAGSAAPSPPVPTPEPTDVGVVNQWPPFRTRGAPENVTLTVEGNELVLRNDTDITFWMMPAGPNIWTGLPWGASDQPNEDVIALSAHAVTRFPLRSYTSPARAGVELWPTPSPDLASDKPWFVWVELP